MANSLSFVEYFAVALPSILRAKGSDAYLGANVRFVVTGRGGGTWTVRLRPPAACVVVGGEWKADLTISITADEMNNMLAGTFDARQALTEGNIELKGDLTLLRKVGFLLRAPPSQGHADAAVAAP